MQVAVPYGAVLLLTTWCYLVVVLKPRDIERIPEIVYHTVGGARPHAGACLTHAR